ncbi:hypothetical protein ACQY0O_005074 [Thecaphora frezii]
MDGDWRPRLGVHRPPCKRARPSEAQSKIVTPTLPGSACMFPPFLASQPPSYIPPLPPLSIPFDPKFHILSDTMDTDDPYSAGAYGGSGAASHPLGPSPPTSHLDAFTPAFVRPPADPPAAPSQPRLYFAELGDAKLMGELPSTDPLSTLLNKHLPSHLRPPRDLSGSWSHPDPFAAHHTAPSWNAAVAVLEGVDEAALQEAVRTSSWRRIATLARFKIERYGAAQARAPEEEAVEGGSVVDVLEWWGVRLHALARLRLYSSMRTELVGLWSVLESIEMPEATQPQAPTTTTTAAAAAAPSSGDVSSSSLHSSPQQQRRIQARPTSSASTASITSTTSGHFVKRTSHARRTLASSPLVPFSLRVMRAREAKYRGDVRAAIDAHVELIGYCKLWIQKWRGARKRRERSKGAATVAGDGAGSEAGAEAKTEAEAIEQMRRQEAIWKDRATRVGLLLASLLAEAKVSFVNSLFEVVSTSVERIYSLKMGGPYSPCGIGWVGADWGFRRRTTQQQQRS